MKRAPRLSVKIEDVTCGTVLVADDSFTCLRPGQLCKVAVTDGQLFVYCNAGNHFLDGQLDAEGTHYIGFRSSK